MLTIARPVVEAVDRVLHAAQGRLVAFARGLGVTYRLAASWGGLFETLLLLIPVLDLIEQRHELAPEFLQVTFARRGI
jgi:hypothetical protein